MGRIACVGCAVACSIVAATICCCRHVPRTVVPPFCFCICVEEQSHNNRWADVHALTDAEV
jgi:hypothetical protein